jgi:hypothetical protein
MGIGWAINSAMIIVAADTFFTARIELTDLSQAAVVLEPIPRKGTSGKPRRQGTINAEVHCMRPPR